MKGAIGAPSQHVDRRRRPGAVFASHDKEVSIKTNVDKQLSQKLAAYFLLGQELRLLQRYAPFQVACWPRPDSTFWSPDLERP